MGRLFDENVEICGGDISTTVPACRMDGSFDSPFGDNATTSTRVRATFTFRFRDWNLTELPKVGWSVKTVQGGRFEVRAVQRLADVLTLDTREVKQ